MEIRESILKKLKNNIHLDTSPDGFYTYLDPKECKNEVQYALKMYADGCSCSSLFFDQLLGLHCKGFVEIDGKRYLYHPINIYSTIQKIVVGAINIKPFNKRNSVLAGKHLYHIHHGQTIHFERNHIRYIEKFYPDSESIEKKLDKIAKIYPQKNPLVIFINETLDKAINWAWKTGEWIVFQKYKENYHFICLANHSDSKDKKGVLFYEKIKDYLLFK